MRYMSVRKRFLSVILTMAILISAVFFFTFSAAGKTEITGKAKIYSLTEGWEPVTNVVDDNGSTQWHCKFWWGVIYLDFGAVYDIEGVDLAFPSGYLNSDGVSYKVDKVSEIPGTKSGNIVTMPNNDNSAALSMPGETLASGQATISNSPVTLSLSGKARYLRINISNSLMYENSTQLNAKLAELKVYGGIAYDASNANLKSISVNGNDIGDFDINEFNHTVAVPEGTQSVTVSAVPLMNDASVSVEQVTGEPSGKTAVITVTSKDNSKTNKYYITFLYDVLVSEGKYSLSYVSSYEDPGNALDGNNDTQWKAFANWGCLFIDLGEEYDLSRFSILFGDGASGVWSYKIDVVSEMPTALANGKHTVDNQAYLGSTYVTASPFSGKTSTNEGNGKLSGKGRFIRIYISGNSNYTGDGMCVVKEFKMFAYEPAFEAKLKSISVDGVKLTDFSRDTLNYFSDVMPGNTPGTVTAVASTSGAKVTITQATTVPGRAIVAVTSKDGKNTTTYYVTFVEYDGKTELISYGKKAMAYGTAGIPGYVFDNNAKTIWEASAKYGALFIDLEGIYKVTRVQIVFDSGSTQNWKFKLDKLSKMPSYTGDFATSFGRYTSSLSNELVVENVFNNTTGTIPGDDVFFLTNSEARYLRLQVSSNSSVTRLGIKDIRIYGYSTGSDNTSLSEITLNGTPLSDFDSNITEYYYPLPYGTSSAPVVAAKTQDQNASSVIKQADSINGKATVNIISSDSSASQTYTIHFMELGAGESLISQGKRYVLTNNNSTANNVSSPTFRSFYENGAYPYTVMDLGAICRITKILNKLGVARKTDVYEFVIDVSNDGQNFIRAFNSDSAIIKGGNLFVNLDVAARYVKVTYFGRDGNKLRVADVKDLLVYGESYDSLISSVTVGGKKLSDFLESNSTYSFSYNGLSKIIPQVEVQTKDGATVTINQAITLTGNASFTVKKGEISRTYTIMLCPSKISLAGENYFGGYKDLTDFEK